MVKISTPCVTDMAAALKAALDGGTLYIFDGPVPASAADDTSGATLLVAIESDAMDTKLHFDTPISGLLPKDPGETWEGTTVSAGTAVFFRFCEDGDDPESADANANRVQGLCGTSPYTAQLVMATTTLGSGATVPVAAFSLIVPEG